MTTLRRRKTDIAWYQNLIFDAPKHIKIGVLIALLIWSWIGFKQIESIIFPVVVNFQIEQVMVEDRDQMIAGTMNKVRDCRFQEIVAYSGDHLIGVSFTETPAPVSRIEGRQAWGWWVITPPVKRLTLYARHQCATGDVMTKLFEGDL